MKIHDGIFPLIAASQKILPTPKGNAVHWLLFDFFSSLRFVKSCSQFTHIILQFYVTMALHSGHITNFHIIQTVRTFFVPYSGLFLLVDNFLERLEWSSVIFSPGFKFHAHSVYDVDLLVGCR